MTKTCESKKQSGKEASLEQLVQDYGDRAFQFAYRLSGNIDEAKDLVQEAFYRAARSWHRYDPARPFDAWFFTILRRLFLDSKKRYARKHVVSLDAAIAGEDSATYADLVSDRRQGILEQLERKETAGLVRDTLSGLSEDHRAVLTLCDMEGMKYDEIARTLGVPTGTIRSRISRARRTFRARSETVETITY